MKTLRTSVGKAGIATLTALTLAGAAPVGFMYAAPAVQQEVAPAPCGDTACEDLGWFPTSAKAIGISVDELFAGLEGRKTIAELATAKGVEAQKVIDALIAGETAWLKQEVAAGSLTQADADELIKGLPEQARAFVQEPVYEDPAQMADEAHELGRWDEISIQVLGIDKEAFFAGLDEGKTVADLASAKGVEAQKVIDALVADETAWMKEQVTAGEFTQAEADEMAKNLPEQARSFVQDVQYEFVQDVEYESEWMADDASEVEDMAAWDAVAMETLGIDSQAFYAGMEEGKTIGDMATEKNVEAQKVIDALVAKDSSWLKEQIAAGTITQEDADQFVALLTEEAQVYVQGGYYESEWMADSDGAEELGGWNAIAAQIIGIDGATYFAGLDEGKSVADLATAKGVEAQKVIDALVADETAWLKEQVTAGEMTQAEADEVTKTLPDQTRSFIQEVYDVSDEDAAATAEEATGWDDIAARVIGIDLNTLYSEQESGKTLAQIAQAKGVEVQKVVDALIADDAAWVKQQVEEGELSQQEADERTQQMPEEAKRFVNEPLSIESGA